MVKYCPDCGDEVKPGYKFCLNCGKKISSSDFEGQVATQQPPIQMPQQPMAQQSYAQTQSYQPMPMKPKKSNMKLIIAVIAIIVVIAVVAVVLFMVLGGGHDSRFVGTWNIASSGGTSVPTGETMTFESNGDLKVGSSTLPNTKVGTWSVQCDKLCMESTYTGTVKQCVSYSFSNGGNTLTITDPTGQGNDLLLTK